MEACSKMALEFCGIRYRTAAYERFTDTCVEENLYRPYERSISGDRSPTIGNELIEIYKTQCDTSPSTASVSWTGAILCLAFICFMLVFAFQPRKPRSSIKTESNEKILDNRQDNHYTV